ncbi:hypothetical protein F7725_013951 [Dissostichus mawsoni]|uniref:Uncharacterized protein n=1 Tax=Dissostichus mawsoni TaxID=36200 RepID=A0A7J5YVQ2_DISMA|nr:hypothetical protein F7725_013951 [Dissostichus mawsoni]
MRLSPLRPPPPPTPSGCSAGFLRTNHSEHTEEPSEIQRERSTEGQVRNLQRGRSQETGIEKGGRGKVKGEDGRENDSESGTRRKKEQR